MDIKIRHKLIEIEDRVSDRFVILVTNYRLLRILEVIRYRRSNRPILKNTRQIYKIHSFGQSKPNNCTGKYWEVIFQIFVPSPLLLL